jgi:hypothetical protein
MFGPVVINRQAAVVDEAVLVIRVRSETPKRRRDQQPTKLISLRHAPAVDFSGRAA